MKTSLHFYSLIKGIPQGGGFLQHQELDAFHGPSPGDSAGPGIPISLAAKRSDLLLAVRDPLLSSLISSELSGPPSLPQTTKSAASEILLIE